MAWHPNDLVTDVDLVSYERTILTQFGVSDWETRRQKAIEDWLFPLLESQGFNPLRFRTRYEPSAVLGVTSSVTTDRTAAASTVDGINLATVLASSSDYLYVGSSAPFRGVSVRQYDAVNTAEGRLTVGVWGDGWLVPADIEDGTRIESTSFKRGGAIAWRVPETVGKRSIGTVGPYYWARLSLSAAPTGASIGPLLVIRRSRLCAAVTFRTLALIFREAPTGVDGPWEAKALWAEQEAERAWMRVANQIGGEFDSDESDGISPTEAAQTAADVTGGGWRFERA